MIELNFLNVFLLISFGFFVGLLGSVLGIGGGAFLVPFLILVFKLPIQNAIAISLISMIATSSAVASVNVEKGLSNVRLGIFMEMTMALGSVLGALIMSKLPADLLQFFFAIFLFPVAISMYLKSKKKNTILTIKKEVKNDKNIYGGTFFDHASNSHTSYTVEKMPLAMFFSFIAGTLSGLFGLGGGIIQVPVMNIVCKVPIKAAAATSNFMIGVSAAASTIVFYRLGYVLEDISVLIIIGVLIGSFIGMKILYKVKSEKIQILFSFLLMIIGLKMLFKVLGQ